MTICSYEQFLTTRFPQTLPPKFKVSKAQDRVADYLFEYLHLIANQIVKDAYSRKLISKKYKIKEMARVPIGGSKMIIYCNELPYVVHNLRVKLEKRLGREVAIPYIISAIEELAQREAHATDKWGDYNFIDMKEMVDAILEDMEFRKLLDRSVYEPNAKGEKWSYPQGEKLNEYLRKLQHIATYFRETTEKALGKPVNFLDVFKEMSENKEGLFDYFDNLPDAGDGDDKA